MFFKHHTNNPDIVDILERTNLKENNEQELIDKALINFKSGTNHHQAIKQLKSQLQVLAVQQKLSPEGLKLLQTLSKPNFPNDLARSSMTWF
ncbi:hypothetical protein [Limosilactobacillus gastricus]|uniref:hypothetical protein n=1 Tax=Limosilactobacillus gastricus TaxID=227942 RepID=UPI0002DE0EB2|nr:hypothetical protein [Limosilactobacillus gastricus]